MAIEKDGVDFYSAPKDYDELFRIYYPYVVLLVKKNGIIDSNKEDVANEILARLLERDWLTFFDPTLTFDHSGKKHSARFKTFLSYAVIDYCRGHRDKQHRLYDRENLTLDAQPRPTQGDPFDEIDESFLEWLGYRATDSHEDAILDQVDGAEFIADLRTYLATIPRRGPFDRCDLVPFFDAIVRQIEMNGAVCIRDLREQFNIGGTGINGWMWWLRANIATYLGVDLPPKRIRKSK